jgi:hypothetical protein
LYLSIDLTLEAFGNYTSVLTISEKKLHPRIEDGNVKRSRVVQQSNKIHLILVSMFLLLMQKGSLYYVAMWVWYCSKLLLFFFFIWYFLTFYLVNILTKGLILCQTSVLM